MRFKVARLWVQDKKLNALVGVSLLISGAFGWLVGSFVAAFVSCGSVDQCGGPEFLRAQQELSIGIVTRAVNTAHTVAGFVIAAVVAVGFRETLNEDSRIYLRTGGLSAILSIGWGLSVTTLIWSYVPVHAGDVRIVTHDFWIIGLLVGQGTAVVLAIIWLAFGFGSVFEKLRGPKERTSRRVTPDVLNGWLAAFGRAWEARDSRAVCALFAEDATYQPGPFDEAMHGLDAIAQYWSHTTAGQEHIQFEHRVLATEEDRGTVHWWAAFTRLHSGARVKLDGILTVTFDQRGRCKTFQEWWHRQEQAV